MFIDHIPSSTTARDLFHGTAISLLQHPSYVGEEADRRHLVLCQGEHSKTIDRLPEYYTEVPPVASNLKVSQVPETSVKSLMRDGFRQQFKAEYQWLGNAKQIILHETPADEAVNISWAAFHATSQKGEARVIFNIGLHCSRKVLTLWP